MSSNDSAAKELRERRDGVAACKGGHQGPDVHVASLSVVADVLILAMPSEDAISALLAQAPRNLAFAALCLYEGRWCIAARRLARS